MSADAAETPRTGGCLCGQVRYTAPRRLIATAVCHCRNCQRQAGTAFSVIAIVPRDRLAIEGQVQVFEDRGDSGLPVWRSFCGRCGSPILTNTPGAREQGVIYLKAGTLDDVADLQPTSHVWTRSRQPWLDLPEGVRIQE